MRVGVPKEIKNHEYRVGLTPASVAELTAAGHEVVVEALAGNGIDFSDRDYMDAGARILPNASEVFMAADMIVKVKESRSKAKSPCCVRTIRCSPICTSPPTSRRRRA